VLGNLLHAITTPDKYKDLDVNGLKAEKVLLEKEINKLTIDKHNMTLSKDRVLAGMKESKKVKEYLEDRKIKLEAEIAQLRILIAKLRLRFEELKIQVSKTANGNTFGEDAEHYSANSLVIVGSTAIYKGDGSFYLPHDEYESQHRLVFSVVIDENSSSAIVTIVATLNGDNEGSNRLTGTSHMKLNAINTKLFFAMIGNNYQLTVPYSNNDEKIKKESKYRSMLSSVNIANDKRNILMYINFVGDTHMSSGFTWNVDFYGGCKLGNLNMDNNVSTIVNAETIPLLSDNKTELTETLKLHTAVAMLVHINEGNKNGTLNHIILSYHIVGKGDALNMKSFAIDNSDFPTITKYLQLFGSKKRLTYKQDLTKSILKDSLTEFTFRERLKEVNY
jgi:hypothetical protein